MKRNVHSGGMTEIICAKRAGSCGSGRVSTRKATLVASYGACGDRWAVDMCVRIALGIPSIRQALC